MMEDLLEQERQYIREAEYHEEMQLQAELDSHSEVLKSYGYIVIPPCDLPRLTGSQYHMTQKPILFNDDDLPF